MIRNDALISSSFELNEVGSLREKTSFESKRDDQQLERKEDFCTKRSDDRELSLI